MTRSAGAKPLSRSSGVAAALLVVAFAVGGCGNSSTSSSPTTATSGGPTSSAPSPAPSSAATVDLVRLAFGLKAPTLDPNKFVEQVSYVTMHLVGGNLTELNPAGSGTLPGLAESLTTSPDGLTVTLKLRPDLKFSDGSPLTSADVEATWKYYLGDEANVNAGVLAPIDTVTADGDLGVIFHLKSPWPSIADNLALPQFAVYPAAGLTDPKKFFEQPISAGVYALSAPRGDGSKLDLTANPNYWGAKPIAQKIEITAVEDPNTRLVQVQSGQVDIADGLPASVIPQLVAPVRAEVVPLVNGGIYLYVNNREAPLSDARVRKAIALAVDRDQINNIAYGGKNQPLLGFFGSQSQFHESFLSPSADVAQAKELLKGTACEAGCALNMMLRSGVEDIKEASVVIQQNLKEIGIDVTIEQVDGGVAGTREYDGNFQTEVNGLSDYIDVPDTVLQYGLVSDGGIFALFSGYSSPEMDAAAHQAITSAGADRTSAIADVNRIFAQDVPFVPLVNVVYVSGSRLPAGIFGQAPSSFYEAARVTDGS